jgi:hypothetical protein
MPIPTLAVHVSRPKAMVRSPVSKLDCRDPQATKAPIRRHSPVVAAFVYARANKGACLLVEPLRSLTRFAHPAPNDWSRFPGTPGNRWVEKSTLTRSEPKSAAGATWNQCSDPARGLLAASAKSLADADGRGRARVN